MLVIINLYVEAKYLESLVDELKQMPEVVDLFEVTGDQDLVLIVEAESIEHFRSVLVKRILKKQGINGSNSLVVLHTHKRMGRLLEE
ncbi:MAG: Lrp/AsnC ligand binding domain-containing protein [Candidatus Korarchaeota archaeon]|nr:Lrp/AsnC ligand binding domain-containing protein [Candidatus Korarchaeota archaeon]